MMSVFSAKRLAKVCRPVNTGLNARHWMRNYAISSVNADNSNVFGSYLGSPVYVKAHYVARGSGIDIHKIHNSDIFGSGRRQEFHAKSLTITIDENLSQYVALFKYGSVVMFNIPESNQREYLLKIKEYGVNTPIADGLHHTEDLKVIVNEHLDRPSVLRSEHLNIRNLNSKNLSIVSTVMAQTVALDYCEVIVNRIVEQFMHMNVTIENTGSFDTLKSQDLFKLVAGNNTVLTNVLAKMGIFEGSDAAWESQDYTDTFELLRKDFEIENRFKDLKLKLEHVKDNAQFFLEVLHNNKSTKLEWTIIILIAAEIIIGLAGLAVHM
jgi:uncharacterized Rmd1/YagE family protein